MAEKGRKPAISIWGTVSRYQGSSGISLPADLEALLGRDLLVAAVPDTGAASTPAVLVRAETAPGSVGHLLAGSDALLPASEPRPTSSGGVLTWGSTSAATRAADGHGGLGSASIFTQVTPGASGAFLVGYVNLAAVAATEPGSSPAASAAADHLKALGVVASVQGQAITYTVDLSVG